MKVCGVGAISFLQSSVFPCTCPSGPFLLQMDSHSSNPAIMIHSNLYSWVVQALITLVRVTLIEYQEQELGRNEPERKWNVRELWNFTAERGKKQKPVQDVRLRGGGWTSLWGWREGAPKGVALFGGVALLSEGRHCGADFGVSCSGFSSCDTQSTSPFLWVKTRTLSPTVTSVHTAMLPAVMMMDWTFVTVKEPPRLNVFFVRVGCDCGFSSQQ